MKFTETGTPRDNYLAEVITMNPREKVHVVLLDHLNYLVGFVAKTKPDTVDVYANSLTEKYLGLVRIDCWDIPAQEIDDVFAQCENLGQYPNLKRASLNYYLHLLQVQNRSEWEMAELKITRRALIEAWVFPSYYFLEALAETIGRADAVKLFKQYITQYYIDHPSPNRDQFVSLEKFVDKRLSGDTKASEWVIVHTLLDEGKYAFKNKNCPTCVDATMDLPDVEFKYLVSCYGDYEKFRSHYGNHMVLTMEHTLIEGDAYCSRVIHDTRIDYDLRHPPKEFWDNFEPGREQEALKYLRRTTPIAADLAPPSG